MPITIVQEPSRRAMKRIGDMSPNDAFLDDEGDLCVVLEPEGDA